MKDLNSCSSCKHFKDGNYCDAYNVNTFSDSSACSKFQQEPNKEICSPVISNKENVAATVPESQCDDNDKVTEYDAQKRSKGCVLLNIFSFKGRIRRWGILPYVFCLCRVV